MLIPKKEYDAVVVGSGPNGLAAAITLAEAGHSVLILEASDRPGGGCRSGELTIPGFLHDHCSAVHPLAVASPFFRSLPLERYGLEWLESPAALAHPLDDGSAALLYRSVSKTAHTLRGDGATYAHTFEYWARHAQTVLDEVLRPPHFPAHPALLARFGKAALRSAVGYAKSQFREPGARGLLAGLAAHSSLPLTRAPSNAVGMVLAIAAHAVGWPFPRGGAQKITDALVAHFQSLHGEIATAHPVRSESDLPRAHAVLFDLVPEGLLEIGRDRLSDSYRRELEAYRPGPGVFKMDFALNGPVPWRATACGEAATLHLGGTLEEIAEAEAAPWRGEISKTPFVLVTQPSLFDASRAPDGSHTLWAYCHVPRHSTQDAGSAIEAQIERFAPGFTQKILARRPTSPLDLERYNRNYVGGDITGGISDLKQAIFRPTLRWSPYLTSRRHWYLCSASTPPGPGVHGMCGYHAAQAAIRRSLSQK